MKESLSVEKRITALKKNNSQEDHKSKKISFKDDSKNKTPKDPFNVEGIQKILKTMTNEMTDIKKQVAENSNSKKVFRNFKQKQTSSSQPLNGISNVESDQDDEEEQLEEEEDNGEEEVGLNGMSYFILSNEEQLEALPVSTRSKKNTETTLSSLLGICNLQYWQIQIAETTLFQPLWDSKI